MLTALRQHFPKLAEEHGAELDRLTKATVAAEHAWKQAEAAVDAAFADEKTARMELIEHLDKNAGKLLDMFPGEKAHVRRFFRPRHRKDAKRDASKTPATATSAA